MKRRFLALLLLLLVTAACWWLARIVDRPSTPEGRSRTTRAHEADVTPEPAEAPSSHGPKGTPSAKWRLVVVARGPKGSPVPGAQARFGRQVVTTDDAGIATLRVQGSGDLVVMGKTFRPTRVAGLTPPESGERRVEVTVDEGLAIEGYVLDQDGGPPSDKVALEVTLIDPPEWLASHGRWVLTDPYGRFRVECLHPGRYEVGVLEVPDGAGLPPASPVEAEAGDRAVRIDLVPAAVVTIRIEKTEPGGPEDRPARFSVLSVGGEWRHIFMFEDLSTRAFDVRLEAGLRYRVDVDTAGWEVVEPVEFDLAVTDRKSAVTVRLRPVGEHSCSLRILFRTDVGAVPEKVQITRMTPGAVQWSEHDVVAGAIVLDLPPGRRELLVGPPESGWPEPWLHALVCVELAPGEHVERAVDLRRGGRIRFRLPQDRGGSLLMGAEGKQLRAVSPSPADDGRGHQIEGDTLRPTGRYVVEWRPRSGETLRRIAVLKPGETTIVDLGSR